MMLCITMKSGEYITVGNNTVILFDRLSGERIHLTIHAPREIAVVRGEVLERQGAQRPACLAKLPPRKKPRKPAAAFLWSDSRNRAAGTLEKLAAQLEENGAAAEAAILREQITRLVPAPWEEDLLVKMVSSGSQPAEI